VKARALTLGLALIAASPPTDGVKGGTLGEPLRPRLTKANIVAFATIVAGEEEGGLAVFRCKVTDGMKGAKSGDVLCIRADPERMELKTEYLLILERRAPMPAPPTLDSISRVCRVGLDGSILEPNTRPLPVRYISVPALFGVAAIDVFGTGIGPLPDFVEPFQVGDGLGFGSHVWVRKTELLRALQEELAALVRPAA